MTREHLVDDIRNVLEMTREPNGPGEGERLRRTFQGLARHLRQEGEIPARVESCVEESLRVLARAGERVDDDTRGYARACLESALDFARGEVPV